MADWAAVVGKIKEKDGRTVEDLYAVISDSLRSSFARDVISDSREDDLHEILLVVLKAIESGELREPDRLMGFIRTLVRRRGVARIRGNIAHRRRFAPHPEIAPSPDPSPEDRALDRDRMLKARAVLASLRTRDREILVRFYFYEQHPDRICREMRLTRTQFRLYKSRALALCARRGGELFSSVNSSGARSA